VILDFGDAWFTAHVWPTVSIGDLVLSLADRGYRDALCAFITHEVLGADESTANGLTLSFGLGSIRTNPEPTELAGPEVAQLAMYDPDAPDTSSCGLASRRAAVRRSRLGLAPHSRSSARLHADGGDERAREAARYAA